MQKSFVESFLYNFLALLIVQKMEIFEGDHLSKTISYTYYYDTVKTTLRQNFNSKKNRLNDFLAESELQSDISST